MIQGTPARPADPAHFFARVLADAETRAEQLGDSFVATEHLLISLHQNRRPRRKMPLVQRINI